MQLNVLFFSAVTLFVALSAIAISLTLLSVSSNNIEDCDEGKYLRAPEGGEKICFNCSGGYYGDTRTNRNRTCSGNCAEGYYCPAGSNKANMLICPPGSYCPAGSESPVLCPATVYGRSEGLKSPSCDGDCTNIQPGYYCGIGSPSDEPIECPKGHYCDGSIGKSSIKPCPGGRYGNTTGLKTELCSGICPIGRYCPVGTSDDLGIICPKGSDCPAGSAQPVPCPNGTFSDTEGYIGFSCKYCKAGVWCPEGSVNEIVKCPEGFACPLGTVNFNSFPCAAGFYCPEGSTSVNMYVCPVGYYCPVGVAKPQPCPAGSYGSNLQESNISACSALCLQGYYCPLGTSEAAMKALPCPPGYFCPPGTGGVWNGLPFDEFKCPAGFCNNVKGLIDEKYCFCNYTYELNLSRTCACEEGHFCQAGCSANGYSPCPFNHYCKEMEPIPIVCNITGYFCPLYSVRPTQRANRLELSLFKVAKGERLQDMGSEFIHEINGLNTIEGDSLEEILAIRRTLPLYAFERGLSTAKVQIYVRGRVDVNIFVCNATSGLLLTQIGKVLQNNLTERPERIETLSWKVPRDFPHYSNYTFCCTYPSANEPDFKSSSEIFSILEASVAFGRRKVAFATITTYVLFWLVVSYKNIVEHYQMRARQQVKYGLFAREHQGQNEMDLFVSIYANPVVSNPLEMIICWSVPFFELTQLCALSICQSTRLIALPLSPNLSLITGFFTGVITNVNAKFQYSVFYLILFVYTFLYILERAWNWYCESDRIKREKYLQFVAGNDKYQATSYAKYSKAGAKYIYPILFEIFYIPSVLSLFRFVQCRHEYYDYNGTQIKFEFANEVSWSTSDENEVCWEGMHIAYSSASLIFALALHVVAGKFIVYGKSCNNSSKYLPRIAHFDVWVYMVKSSACVIHAFSVLVNTPSLIAGYLTFTLLLLLVLCIYTLPFLAGNHNSHYWNDFRTASFAAAFTFAATVLVSSVMSYEYVSWPSYFLPFLSPLSFLGMGKLNSTRSVWVLKKLKRKILEKLSNGDEEIINLVPAMVKKDMCFNSTCLSQNSYSELNYSKRLLMTIGSLLDSNTSNALQQKALSIILQVCKNSVHSTIRFQKRTVIPDSLSVTKECYNWNSSLFQASLKHVQYLDLSDQGISNEVVNDIAYVLRTNKDSVLQYIDISGNKIGYCALNNVLDALSVQHNSVINVKMERCPSFSPFQLDVNALKNILMNNSNVEVLNFGNRLKVIRRFEIFSNWELQKRRKLIIEGESVPAVKRTTDLHVSLYEQERFPIGTMTNIIQSVILSHPCQVVNLFLGKCEQKKYLAGMKAELMESIASLSKLDEDAVLRINVIETPSWRISMQEDSVIEVSRKENTRLFPDDTQCISFLASKMKNLESIYLQASEMGKEECARILVKNCLLPGFSNQISKLNHVNIRLNNVKLYDTWLNLPALRGEKPKYSNTEKNELVHTIRTEAHPIFPSNHDMQLIDLSKLKLRNGDMIIVSHALKYNTTVKELNASGNYIGSTGVEALIQCFQHQRTIRSKRSTVSILNLSDNLVDANAATLISNGLFGPAACARHCFDLECAKCCQSAPMLLSLNLSNNRLFAEGVKNLVLSQKMCYLQELALCKNSIGDDGVTALAEGLRANGTLKILRITENNISSIGSKSLSKYLKASTHSALEEIYIDRNNISCIGALEIIEGLGFNHTMKILSVESNNIMVHGSAALAKALNATTLTGLYMGFNSISDEGLLLIAAALRRTKRSEQLSIGLQDINITDKGIKSISDAIMENIYTSLSLCIDLKNNFEVSSESKEMLMEAVRVSNERINYSIMDKIDVKDFTATLGRNMRHAGSGIIIELD